MFSPSPVDGGREIEQPGGSLEASHSQSTTERVVLEDGFSCDFIFSYTREKQLNKHLKQQNATQHIRIC